MNERQRTLTAADADDLETFLVSRTELDQAPAMMRELVNLARTYHYDGL
jgi:hypothetical protein